jgi:hypothetical protein
MEQSEMAKPKYTVEIPTQEEFENMFGDMSEEEFEAQIEALENVETMDELIELLQSVGVELVDESSWERGPGPHDTIH